MCYDLFPLFLTDRQIYFSDIVSIDVKRSDIPTEKWQIAGSGDFRSLYPPDTDCPSHDRIFHATLKAGGWNIGFAVENSSRVISTNRAQKTFFTCSFFRTPRSRPLHPPSSTLNQLKQEHKGRKGQNHSANKFPGDLVLSCRVLILCR